MQPISKRSVILNLLIIVVLISIFLNSLPDIATSSVTSMKVTEFLKPILEHIFGEGSVSHHLVRKMAHFAEFWILGLIFGVLFRKMRALPFFLLLLFGLCDETIQLYTGRGAMVEDIWLDYIGGITGFLIGVLILTIVRYCRQRKYKMS